MGFRLSLYTSNPGLLIITIPTGVHEALHSFLYDSIHLMNVMMGLPRVELLGAGATAFSNLDAAGNVRSQGEGDSSLRPHVRLPNGFPTVVIEAGYTQSWDSLRQKARWWFTASDFDVKIVILTKFERPRGGRGGRIIIEKWKAVEAGPLPGPRTWAQANAPLAPQATCIDTIHITHHAPDNDIADPASYNITGPLHLEFFDVYLRQPIEGLPEGDIIIDIAELQNYGVAVWSTYE